MAEVNFFDSFGTKWSQAGNADPIQDDQYRAGWAYIGSTPPSVEQFNKWGQLSDEKHNWFFAQLKSAADDKGIELSGNDLDGLLKILRSFGDESPRTKTFAQAVALTENIGLITVIGMDGIWEWSSSPYFTGYRHPRCGSDEDGWTPNPLPFQILATGGTWRESDEKERRVIAQYRESGRVVTSANWKPGQDMIADIGGGNWKAPDKQNMFMRKAGTDADTANAKPLGAYQQDALQNITGHAGDWLPVGLSAGISSGALYVTGGHSMALSGSIEPGHGRQVGFNAARSPGARTSTETRSASSTVSPFIHV